MSGGGIEFRAVGASLDTLAKTVRSAAANQKTAFAYANSGILQLAAGVLTSRYLVPGTYAKPNPRRGRDLEYLAPPGATHGPMVRTIRDQAGNINRNERGQWVKREYENKIFVKGKFVSRDGAIEWMSRDLATEAPTVRLGVVLATEDSGRANVVEAGITRDGSAYWKMTGGYRAAEVGSRKSGRAGIKGVWRSLRTVQGRWSTLLRKKYPDLLKLRAI